MQVAIHELKAGLSRYLSHAQAGEVIEVTSHRRPIARIVGIPDAGSQAIGQLVASGAVAWSGAKPRFDEPVILVGAGTPVSLIVLKERG